jgi:hypothetical protein
MNELIETYPITSTVLNSVDPEKLSSEIQASGAVYNFGAINVYELFIEIWGESVLDKTALDAVIAAHDSYNIQTHKSKMYTAIDARTSYLISQGFTYDGHLFSLSLVAQHNWDTIHTNKAVFSFPFEVTTLDNNTYALNYSNVDSFWGTAVLTVKTHWDSGRVLKKQVFEATTKTQIDAVVDTR